MLNQAFVETHPGYPSILKIDQQITMICLYNGRAKKWLFKYEYVGRYRILLSPFGLGLHIRLGWRLIRLGWRLPLYPRNDFLTIIVSFYLHSPFRK
jgi:hypothetical protein